MELETNTGKYAKTELEILTATVEDPIIAPFADEIIALCEKFGKSGQSGGSAPMVAAVLGHAVKTLCSRRPICDITGVDEEWMDVTEMNEGVPMYQNKRCYAAFKMGKDAPAYYLDAIVWKCGDDNTFTGSVKFGFESISSQQYIKAFPFKPKTFYVDVEKVEDEWRVQNPDQLHKAFKYYNLFNQ